MAKRRKSEWRVLAFPAHGITAGDKAVFECIIAGEMLRERRGSGYSQEEVSPGA